MSVTQFFFVATCGKSSDESKSIQVFLDDFICMIKYLCLRNYLKKIPKVDSTESSSSKSG